MADAALAREMRRTGRNDVRVLADNTGGLATIDTNNFDTGVRRMLAESGQHYLLGYYSQAPRDGKTHKIQVRTTRRGLTVRARPTYHATRTAPGETPDVSTEAVATGLLPVTGLDLRTVAVAVPAASKTGSALAVMVEVRLPESVRGERLELVTLAVDREGRVVARDRFAAALRASSSDATQRWLRVASRLDVPHGRYHVRVAARRTGGPTRDSAESLTGSAFAYVDVPNFSRGLTVGGLALATPTRGGVSRADLIPGEAVPIATHEVRPGMPLMATLALRSTVAGDTPISIVTTLERPDGSSVELDRTSRSAADARRSAGIAYAVPVPTATLEPGVFRIRAAVEHGEHTVMREIRLLVVPP